MIFAELFAIQIYLAKLFTFVIHGCFKQSLTVARFRQSRTNKRDIKSLACCEIFVKQFNEYITFVILLNVSSTNLNFRILDNTNIYLLNGLEMVIHHIIYNKNITKFFLYLLKIFKALDIFIFL